MQREKLKSVAATRGNETVLCVGADDLPTVYTSTTASTATEAECTPHNGAYVIVSQPGAVSLFGGVGEYGEEGKARKTRLSGWFRLGIDVRGGGWGTHRLLCLSTCRLCCPTFRHPPTKQPSTHPLSHATCRPARQPHPSCCYLHIRYSPHSSTPSPPPVHQRCYPRLPPPSPSPALVSDLFRGTKHLSAQMVCLSTPPLPVWSASQLYCRGTMICAHVCLCG